MPKRKRRERYGILVRCRTREECEELRTLLEKAKRKYAFEVGTLINKVSYRDVILSALRMYLGEDVVSG